MDNHNQWVRPILRVKDELYLWERIIIETNISDELIEKSYGIWERLAQKLCSTVRYYGVEVWKVTIEIDSNYFRGCPYFRMFAFPNQPIKCNNSIPTMKSIVGFHCDECGGDVVVDYNGRVRGHLLYCSYTKVQQIMES